jgi:hypothetical protein
MTIESSNADLQALEIQRAKPSSANLPLVDESSASPETRSLFQQYRDRFGRAELPAILLCFATHPPLLRAMLEIARRLLFADCPWTRPSVRPRLLETMARRLGPR